MMRRRYSIAAFAIVGVLGFAFWFASAPRTGSSPEFLGDTPVSIDIAVMQRPLFTITNAVALVAVMEMLRSGRSVEAHECKSRGTMEIRFPDGHSVSLGFHPGHQFLRYEFAARGKMFAVSRSRFLGALKAAGVDVHKIPSG
jgi:hypothetical protein